MHLSFNINTSHWSILYPWRFWVFFTFLRMWSAHCAHTSMCRQKAVLWRIKEKESRETLFWDIIPSHVWTSCTFELTHVLRWTCTFVYFLFKGRVQCFSVQVIMNKCFLLNP